jgi:hypothetical protein
MIDDDEGHAANEPKIELTLGRSSPAPARPSFAADREDELTALIERCRASALAARRIVRHESGDREEASHGSPEEVAAIHGLAERVGWARAKDEWMTDLLPRIEELGNAYEALAEALELAREVTRTSGPRTTSLGPSLTLLAEAQAMVRVAIDEIGGAPDPDQLTAFDWLKRTAAERRTYVPRYMRADQRPSLSGQKDLRERLRRERARRGETRSANVRDAKSKDQPKPEFGPQVRTAAKLLSGKSVLLIGGDDRPEARQALEAAFRLRELFWIETKVHESIDRFQHAIARPEVALVLLAIRWASHSFGDVKEFCERYGKPLVRLPGGYGPNQVAEQVLSQASGHLRSR